MSVVAAAVVGTGLVGAYSSNRAADKAADASKAGMAATNALAKQARTDSINLFMRGLQSGQAGIGSALNFYQNNATAKIKPFVQGNMAAQQVLGQGATQANNAILGLPVDMSFANNPQSLSADYSGIESAQLPTLGASQPDQTGLGTLLALPPSTASSSGGNGALNSIMNTIGASAQNTIDAVKNRNPVKGVTESLGRLGASK